MIDLAARGRLRLGARAHRDDRARVLPLDAVGIGQHEARFVLGAGLEIEDAAGKHVRRHVLERVLVDALVADAQQRQALPSRSARRSCGRTTATVALRLSSPSMRHSKPSEMQRRRFGDELAGSGLIRGVKWRREQQHAHSPQPKAESPGSERRTRKCPFHSAYYAPVSVYAFDDFVVDAVARRVTRGGEVVPIPDRHFGVLLHLLAHAGTVVSKDQLIASAWDGVAVTDNSLEQAISGLRRLLGDGPAGSPYIETVPDAATASPAPVTRTTRARDRRLRSRRCSRRIARGSKDAPRSRRSSAIRSAARAPSSRACCAARRIRHRRTSGWPTPAPCSSR